MRILVLRDRKPGHFRQAEAVASRLAVQLSGELDAVDVRPRWFAHEYVRRGLARRIARPATWLKLFYGLDPAALAKADLIVASGRPTILAGLLLAELWSARLVYRGVAIGYEIGAPHLVLVAGPATARPPYRAYVPMPAPIDPDALPPPRRVDGPAALQGARGSLLIGGNSMTHRFTSSEWSQLLDLVKASADRLGVVWSITNSRRTPDEVSNDLAALAARVPPINFIDFRTAGPGSIDPLLAADFILVTSDSVSMVGDACNAMRPVLALDPAAIKPAGQRGVADGFAAIGQLARIPLGTVTADQLAPLLAGLSVPAISHRSRLDQALAEWLALEWRSVP